MTLGTVLSHDHCFATAAPFHERCVSSRKLGAAEWGGPLFAIEQGDASPVQDQKSETAGSEARGR